MTETVFLRDFSVVMAAAAAVTLLFRKLNQPAVLGYLLAGLLIGPHTPPFAFVKDLHSIHTMASLGIVFLLFSLGFEFSLPRLRRVGPSAAITTLLEVPAMALVGYFLGRFFGWNGTESVILGAIMCISSTSVIVKVLTDLKLFRSGGSDTALGILILEDVAAVLLLTVVSGLISGLGVGGSTLIASLLRVSFFVILFGVVGLALVPRLTQWAARTKSMETLGVLSLGLCLLGALAASEAGYSVALGAFLIGTIVGVTPECGPIETWFQPVRDLFTAIFFVSAGMLLDPQMLYAYAGPIVLVTLVTITGKILFVSSGTFLAGHSVSTALQTGFTLSQIGEFSFVFGSLALASPKAGDFLYPLAVAVASVTAFTTPFFIRHAEALSAIVIRLTPKPLQHLQDGYLARIERFRNRAPSPTGTILSRYMFRLGLYIALWMAVYLLTGRAAGVLHQERFIPALLWSAAYLLLVPLFLAVVYYINHFLLLALTESIVRLRATRLLSVLPIHKAYTATETLLMGLLTLAWFLRARSDFADPRLWAATLVILPAMTYLLRGLYRKGYVVLEGFLDHLVGLTTSEPLRLAALTRHENEITSEDELMEKIYLEPESPVVERHLRAVGLREKTGATVVGIYRRGKLLANPKADTVLLANDILVIMGDAQERAQARAVLNG